MIDGHASTPVKAMLHGRRVGSHVSHVLVGMTGIFAKLQGSCVGFAVRDNHLHVKVDTKGADYPCLGSLLRNPQSQVAWCPASSLPTVSGTTHRQLTLRFLPVVSMTNIALISLLVCIGTEDYSVKDWQIMDHHQHSILENVLSTHIARLRGIQSFCLVFDQ